MLWTVVEKGRLSIGRAEWQGVLQPDVFRVEIARNQFVMTWFPEGPNNEPRILHKTPKPLSWLSGMQTKARNLVGARLAKANASKS